MNYSDMKDWELFILLQNNDSAAAAHKEYMRRIKRHTWKLLEKYGYPTALVNDKDFITDIAEDVSTSYKPRMRTAFLKYLELSHIVDNNYKKYSPSEETPDNSTEDTQTNTQTNAQTKKVRTTTILLSGIANGEDNSIDIMAPNTPDTPEELIIEDLELIKTHNPIFYEIIELLQEPGALMKVKLGKEKDKTFITPYHLQRLFSYMLQLGNNENGSSDSDSQPKEVINDQQPKEVINGNSMDDEYSFKRAFDTWQLCMQYYNSNDN